MKSEIDQLEDVTSEVLKMQAWQRALVRAEKISEFIGNNAREEGALGDLIRGIITHRKLKVEGGFDPKNCVLGYNTDTTGKTRWMVISQGDRGVVTEASAGPNALRIIQQYKAEMQAAAIPSVKLRDATDWAELKDQARERQEKYGEISRVFGRL